MKHFEDEMHGLMHKWASHLGYYDGRIDLNITDLSGFTTPDCSLLAHAPLWGTKFGQEKPIPVGEVRKSLARNLRWAKAIRHDMHVARHPSKNELAFFFVVKIRPKFVPINIMTVPLAFIVRADETEAGLRIAQIDEWAAKTAADAETVLVEKCGWPETTSLEPNALFGAVS